jgi:glycosyltransferase involved in cell wall biosynthesis
MKGISAVVATYNRKTELENLFQSLLLSQFKEFELIIVDQNTDGLIDALVKEYQESLSIVHLKYGETNQSKARNYGAKQAKYPVVCFPDDDCWFDPDSFFKVVTHFEKNQTDLLIVKWKQHPGFPSTSQKLHKKAIYSFRSVGYATIVLFFRKEVLIALGGFTETIGIGQYIGGGEDSELTFRAVRNHLNIYYDASIYVNHKYAPINTRSQSIIRTRQRAMGMIYAQYDIPYHIIARGLASPLLKMVIPGNIKRSSEYYNMFLGRWEGFLYTMKNKKKLFSQ